MGSICGFLVIEQKYTLKITLLDLYLYVDYLTLSSKILICRKVQMNQKNRYILRKTSRSILLAHQSEKYIFCIVFKKITSKATLLDLHLYVDHYKVLSNISIFRKLYIFYIKQFLFFHFSEYLLFCLSNIDDGKLPCSVLSIPQYYIGQRTRI